LKKTICILLMLLSLNGCIFTQLVMDDARRAKWKHYTIGKVISATENTEGTIDICILGKIVDQPDSVKYSVSLPKDKLLKYGVRDRGKAAHDKDRYLISTGTTRKIGDQSIKRYRFGADAISRSCRSRNDQPHTPLKVSNLGSDHCKNGPEHDIIALPPTQPEFNHPATYELPCCDVDCSTIIIAPSEKGVYPFELTGGEVEALTNPEALLYLPVAIIGDIVSAPIQFIILLGILQYEHEHR